METFLKEKEKEINLSRISNIDLIKNKFVKVLGIIPCYKKGIFEIVFNTNLSKEELKGFIGIFGYDVIKTRDYLDNDVFAMVRVNEE